MELPHDPFLKCRTGSVMEKPDLTKVSISFFGLDFGVCAFGEVRREGVVKLSRHFAHCGEMLQYQRGRGIHVFLKVLAG